MQLGGHNSGQHAASDVGGRDAGPRAASGVDQRRLRACERRGRSRACFDCWVSSERWSRLATIAVASHRPTSTSDSTNNNSVCKLGCLTSSRPSTVFQPTDVPVSPSCVPRGPSPPGSGTSSFLLPVSLASSAVAFWRKGASNQPHQMIPLRASCPQPFLFPNDTIRLRPSPFPIEQYIMPAGIPITP